MWAHALERASMAKAAVPGAAMAAASVIAVVDTSAVTVAVVGGVAGLTAAVLTYLGSVNKERIAGTDHLIGRLQDQLDQAEARRLEDRKADQDARERLEAKVLHLERGAWRLAMQVQGLGSQPVWVPGTTTTGDLPPREGGDDEQVG